MMRTKFVSALDRYCSRTVCNVACPDSRKAVQQYYLDMKIFNLEVRMLDRAFTVEADKMKKACKIKAGSGILEVFWTTEQFLLDVYVSRKNSVQFFVF